MLNAGSRSMFYPLQCRHCHWLRLNGAALGKLSRPLQRLALHGQQAPLRRVGPGGIVMLLEDLSKRLTERALVAGSRMPPWPETVRGVPNGVLRSALFGAIGRCKRARLDRELIASVEGVVIWYSGMQLDQTDLDVWEGILHLSRNADLVQPIQFGARQFLRLIGRGGPNGDSLGKGDRKWLKSVITRLAGANVELRQGPYTYIGSLINEVLLDDTNGQYMLTLNPRMRVLFSRDAYTGVDWTIRRSLQGYPLAQWLHGYYSTHARPYPLNVDTLHSLCGSKTGASAKTEMAKERALRCWRTATLEPALQLLEKAHNDCGQYFRSKISPGGLVTVERTPTIAQKKHLQKRGQYPLLFGG